MKEFFADLIGLHETAQTISALWHSKQTGVGAKDLSGPVGILAILASQESNH